MNMPYSIDSFEFKLGICCSAINLDLSEGIISKIKNLENWDDKQFIDFLQKHRIAELAYSVLQDSEVLSVPVKLQLASGVKKNQLKALSAFRTQCQLQSFFNENDIQSIFLKGILLSHLYYGDLGLRNVFDIDVWVEEEHIDKVSAFLETIGYRKITGFQKFSERQLKYLRLSSHHEVFLNPDDEHAVPVELHWRIRNSLGNFVFNPVIERRNLMQVHINEFNFTVLNHIDQFIFLSVHGAEHGWYRIKWLADLYHIHKTISIDWNTLVKRAIDLRSIKEVKMAGYLLNQFYKITCSNDLTFFKLTFIDRLRIKYVKHIMQYPNVYCDTRMEKIKNGIYLLSLNRRVYIAKELLFKNLTRPVDWASLPLPDYLFFLYFPLRPFLWLYRMIKYKLC